MPAEPRRLVRTTTRGRAYDKDHDCRVDVPVHLSQPLGLQQGHILLSHMLFTLTLGQHPEHPESTKGRSWAQLRAGWFNSGERLREIKAGSLNERPAEPSEEDA